MFSLITGLLGLCVILLVFLYIAAGVYFAPKYIYDTIKNPSEGLSTEVYEIIYIAIIILIILIVIAYFLSKNQDYDNYVNTVKKFLLISFPFYYAVTLLISYLLKDTNTFNIMLFKSDDSVVGAVLEICLFHSVCCCYPVLISSFVYKILAEKRMMKEFAIEQSYRNEEKRKEQEIEQANNEIEYYKKLGDLENLLKQKTITQEKFNELKSKLKIQHNIK